ncbi:5' nucleotidase, NT5C type [Ureibacillus aquaedulcis]|uniref:Nucleotidase n=1 Tax=Ureibacillus aquaedulcis TaxID=3058421 RepID=A0ABT8GPU4_9BACL|nr:HAD family acid phosphatase [Ureibacillus sp. BA0131]MDN4493432.1 HAD family acid phosphatase [Ureibacillus sp. BA0131]
MRFGFDIDDTLINLREHAFHIYNRKLNQNVGVEIFRELKTVEIHEAFGLDKVAGGEMWNSLLEEIYFTDCPSFDGALELLNRLEREGHEIFYITSRPKQYCQKTQEWVKDQGFPVHEQRFFCGMQDQEKIEIIRQLDLDFYFDDKPAVLHTLSDIATKVYVKDQSYNQDVGIPRVKEWTSFTY